MRCNDYISLLSGHIDGKNSEVEERRLQQHLQACKACRALLEQMEQADTALRESRQEPPAELTVRIMAQVRKEPKQKRSHRRTIFSVGATGLAAAALLAFVFFGDLKLPALSSGENAPVITVYEQASEYPRSANTEQNFYMAPILPDSTLFEPVIEAAPSEELPSSTQQQQPAMDASPSEAPVDGKENIDATTPSAADDLTLPTVCTDITAPQDSTEATGSSKPHRKPPKLASSEAAAPLLIIWNAQPESFAPLKDLTPLEEPPKSDAPPAEDTEQTNGAAAESGNLYTRLLATLPLGKKLSEASPELLSKPALSIMKYLVSYEQFSALFTECIGAYETAVYYPANLRDLDCCTVLVISGTEQPPTE